MSVQSFAPVTEYETISVAAGSYSFGSGENFRVYGITAATVDGTARTVSFTDNSGNNILDIRVAGNSTSVMNVPFIADNGLKIPSPPATLNITVFRSHPGT